MERGDARVGIWYCAGIDGADGDGMIGGTGVGLLLGRILGVKIEKVGMGIKYSYITIIDGA